MYGDIMWHMSLGAARELAQAYGELGWCAAAGQYVGLSEEVRESPLVQWVVGMLVEHGERAVCLLV